MAAGRNHPATLDPNSVDYGQLPEVDPGHTHTAKSVTGVGTTSPVVTVPTPSTGVAFQPSTTQDSTVYVDITTSASLTVAIGSTASTTTTIYAAASAALGVITVRVPAGWWVKLTGTMADVTVTQVVG